MMWLHTNLCWCGYLIIFLPPFIFCFLDFRFYPLFYPNFPGYFPAVDDDVTNFFALLLTGFNISSSNFSFNFSDVDSGCRLNCFLWFTLFQVSRGERSRSWRTRTSFGIFVCSGFFAKEWTRSRFLCRRVDSFAKGISAILPFNPVICSSFLPFVFYEDSCR